MIDPAHLFTFHELYSICQDIRTKLSKVHPAHERRITVYKEPDGFMVTVSGGDLGDFICPVECAKTDVNWVADALGRAPNPEGAAA
jgi:hypothetical protein